MFYKYQKYKKVPGNFDEYWTSYNGTVIRIKDYSINKSGLPEILDPFEKNGAYYLLLKTTFREWKLMSVSRLVALAWLPNVRGLKEVMHIDKNRLNNSVDNLKWVTTSERAKRGWATRRNNLLKRIQNGEFKTLPREARWHICKDDMDGISRKEIAKVWGISVQYVCSIVKERTKK